MSETMTSKARTPNSFNAAAADVAVVHVSAHLKSAQGAGAQEADAVITLVMTKENGAWKIAAFQNTSVAAGRH